MARLLLFLSAVLLFQLSGRSQVTVSVEPGSFVLTGNPTQTDISFHLQVTNTSSTSANIYWGKRMTNGPSQWYTWICDKNLCYTPDINSCPASKPNALAPGEALEMQVHMNPALTEGSADYELSIIDELGNILFVANGEFLISYATAVKETSESKLTVFPNPTSDFFKVSETPGLKTIELFNIVGNKVRSYDAVPQKQYYVGDLTDGIYLVRLESATGKIVRQSV